MFLLSLKVGRVTKGFMGLSVDPMELFFNGASDGVCRNALHTVWRFVAGLSVAAETIHLCGHLASKAIEIDLRCRSGAKEDYHPLTEGQPDMESQAIAGEDDVTEVKKPCKLSGRI